MIYKYALELNSLDKCSEWQEVFEVLEKYEGFYKNSIYISPDSYTYRSRLESVKFTINDKQDLSYIADPKYVNLGRANISWVPVFYGSSNATNSELNHELAMKNAILESSKNRRINNIQDFKEFGYLSRWANTLNLKMYSFLNFDFGINGHPELNKAKQDEVNNIYKWSGFPERDIEINKWIANIFGFDFEDSDPCKYKISSMLAHNMMNNYDGILYPSIQTHGMAYNVALRKTAADTLRLESVIELESYQFNGQTGVKWGNLIELD